MERVSYLNQPDCLRLSNDSVELIVTTGSGPRILRYGFLAGENILGEFTEMTVDTSLGIWRALGGHRLWAAPEAMPRSYAPDNDPIEYLSEGENHVRLIGRIDATGIAKEIDVTLDDAGSGVTIVHTIINHNLWGIDLAPWALTIMNGGGVVILPQEPYRSHGEELLPARPLALWGYTDLSDPRWTIGPRFIRLQTDESLTEPQKIGILNRQGWAAYHRSNQLFVKRFPYHDGLLYPDFDSNNETYTAGAFIELETLGPLTHLQPGESAEHTERWQLFADVEIGTSEESIGRVIEPLVARTRAV